MEELIEALQILVKYANPNFPTCCDHDVLYINSDIAPKNVSEEDKKKLEELGFIVTEECGELQFISYKYGSY